MDSGGRRLTAEEHLKAYGIAGDVRHFNRTVSPELLDYLDLVEPRRKQPLLPHGVAENRGLPLLFFIDETSPATTPTTNSEMYEEDLRSLRRVLASRGDRAYLARVLPGELRVVPVSLDQRTPPWGGCIKGGPRRSRYVLCTLNRRSIRRARGTQGIRLCFL